VGFVLFVAWVVGAIFAKFVSYYQTRSFVVEQVQGLSQSLINVIDIKSDLKINTNQPNQLIYVWNKGQLISQQGMYDIPVPTKSDVYVKAFTDVKWVISTHCEAQKCVLVGLLDNDRKFVVRRIVVGVFIGMLFLLGAVMIAMYYAISSGLKPLDKLATELSRSDFTKLVSIDSNDYKARELKPLVKAVNQLTINIKTQLQEERRFLDTCTHELRTPVAGLLAQIQSLPEIKVPQNEQHQSIKSAANRTIRVATQFLNLAKNKNSESSLAANNSIFDLPELIRQMSAEILINFNNINCQLLGKDKLKINADPLAMEMVIRNLLENACRYGKSSSSDQVTINISLAQKNSETILTMEDSGMGVSESDLAKLSQRFFRAARDYDSENSEGAGLGLSIVSEIAERYNGTLDIKKSHELGGLSVKVVLKDIFVDMDTKIIQS